MTRDRECLIFLHIPKAAGTTLHRIIQHQYSEAVTFTIDGGNVYESIRGFKRLPQTRRDEFDCLKGHMPFGLHEYLSRPCVYVTLLRDPVERMISHYYYVVRTSHHYLHQEVLSRGMTLEDYVRSDISTELENGQTKLIAGNEIDPPPNLLDLAKRNIREHFVVAGLAERFDEALILMQRRLGWSQVYYTPKNVTAHRPSKSEVSKSTLRMIESRNEKDLELYDFARRLFDDDVRQEGIDFSIAVEAFRFRNQGRRMLYRSRSLFEKVYQWLG